MTGNERNKDNAFLIVFFVSFTLHKYLLRSSHGKQTSNDVWLKELELLLSVEYFVYRNFGFGRMLPLR